MSELPLGGLVGRGPLLGGLQSQHCPWRRKNIPKKKPVTDEPHALPSHPRSPPPNTQASARSREAHSPFFWDCTWP